MKPAGASGPVLITGGAGFIGSNLAQSFLLEGRPVTVFDNLSRPGVERNLDWLRGTGGRAFRFVEGDVRDPDALAAAVTGVDAVYHLAAQTAVTTSLADPVGDFAINAQGTLNLLEAVRRTGRSLPVIFSSTNKVYGALEDLALAPRDGRYLPEDEHLRRHGIGEDRPLQFSTPYGCSKGVADQYVLDYAASFGIPTAVLRMSCIYGPRQFGTEDQGWVAHFLIAALRGDPVTIYGDGRQVRDILFVDDAVAAYRRTLETIDSVAGQAFNLGGGPGNAVSVGAVLAEIADLVAPRLEVAHGPWRQGDQYYFVADTRRLQQALGWRARIGWQAGLRRLHDWLVSSAAPVRSSRRELA